MGNGFNTIFRPDSTATPTKLPNSVPPPPPPHDNVLELNLTSETITQAMLDDPNSLLRAHISKQNIISTTTIFVSTAPPPPVGLFGGGTDNIAFLLGQPAATAPNAQATKMTAVFWIETVQETILVPILKLGQPFAVKAQPSIAGQRVPTFSGLAPFDSEMPRKIAVTFTQIQYSQTVLLNFNGLTWPHVSVNTLVPADDIIVPASAWK